MNSADRVRTHGEIDRELVGTPIDVAGGRATVRLAITPNMAADHRGLAHGGFVFGLADYAAMLAVNEPTVVLAAASCRFLAPVRVGDEVVAEAERSAVDGKKHTVRVVARAQGVEVFSGEFVCAVPALHVLDREAAAHPPTVGP